MSREVWTQRRGVWLIMGALLLLFAFSEMSRVTTRWTRPQWDKEQSDHGLVRRLYPIAVEAVRDQFISPKFSARTGPEVAYGAQSLLLSFDVESVDAHGQTIHSQVVVTFAVPEGGKDYTRERRAHQRGETR